MLSVISRILLDSVISVPSFRCNWRWLSKALNPTGVRVDLADRAHKQARKLTQLYSKAWSSCVINALWLMLSLLLNNQGCDFDSA